MANFSLHHSFIGCSTQPRGRPSGWARFEAQLPVGARRQRLADRQHEFRGSEPKVTRLIDCYNPENRHKRKAIWDANKNLEGRWRKFTYEELTARDKTSLDVFWLKDKSLTDLDNLPEPDDLAEEIIENLEAGLNSFRQVLAGLNKVV
jgi:hypothetical protein